MSSALPITLLFVGLFIGLVLGAALGWFVHSSRTSVLPLSQPPAGDSADTAELALSVNKSVNQSVAQTMVPLERAMESWARSYKN